MSQDNLTGKTIKGYELKEQLGAGGFGAVYRAHQAAVHRDVAVKVILPQYANHPDFIRRFEAEAQIIARLEHPYIVPLYDFWRDADGAFLVMRWLQSSLRKRLRGSPLSLELTARLLDQIASALAAAHRRGIIHRDLKPDNILLDADQNAYLADFGIAKDLSLVSDLSEAGQVVGTLSVISPEQLRAETVTARSDLYSLGMVLYEILVGRQPYRATSPSEWVMKHLTEPVPFVRVWRPELPESVDQVIQIATAKEPADRYPDALSLANAFRRALAGASAASGLESDQSTRTVSPTSPHDLPQERTSQLNAPASEQEFNTPTEHSIKGLVTDGVEGPTVTPADAMLPGVPPTPLASQANAAPRTLTPAFGMATGLLPPTVENPYKGLRAFQEADAADFFGRDDLRKRLLDRLNVPAGAPRFLAVVGPSGSGKSSVVRAGLVPALRQGALPESDRWFGTVITPGTNPLEEVEAALLRIAINPPASLLTQIKEDERGLLRAIKRILPTGEANRFVLVIDQFEELFTQFEDESARAFLLNSLVAAVSEPNSPLVLIITLRADYYDRPLQYAAFGELLRQHTEVVLPLSMDELEQVIAGPARRVGLLLEPGLIDAIRNDLIDQPGALPLLEYALTELYDRREGLKLTMAAYRASGGALGAVTRRADILYELLDSAGQAAVRQLFLRLLTIGDGTDDMRRRVSQPELLTLLPDPAPMELAILRYSQHYLLTFDRDPITRTPTVEVAHEALIRRWTRLREWIAASRDDLQVQRRLSQATADWHTAALNSSVLMPGARLDQFKTLTDSATDSVSSFLSFGARLEQFKTLVDRGTVSVSQDEREYVTISLAADQARRTEAIRQAEYETALQRQAANRLRALALGLAVFLIAAAGLSLFAFNSRSDALSSAASAMISQGQALDSAATAQSNYARSESLRLASEADSLLQNQNGNVELAALLSVRALQVVYTVQADAASIQAASRLFTIERFTGHTRGVVSVAFAPDGQFVVTGSGDDSARLWNPNSGILLHTLAGHRATVNSVAVSADSALILTGSADKTARLWDVSTGQSLKIFSGPNAAVTSVAFAPDGQTVAIGYADMNARLWDIANAKLLQTFSGHRGAISGITFSPDGKAILTASLDKTAQLWDASNGQSIQIFSGHTDAVTSVAFSADGKMVATGSVDKSARLWAVSDGTLIKQFVGHADTVTSVAFSPDGQSLLTGSHDKTARLWSISSGAVKRLFSGHDNWLTSVAFSTDGQTILTGSEDTTARLWLTGLPSTVRQLTGHTGPLWSVAVSADNKLFATGSEDTTARVWDARTLTPLVTLSGHTDTVTSVAFSADGRYVLTGSYDKTARWWDAQTGQKVQTFSGHTNYVSAVAISPDGKLALTGSWDKTARLWDVQSGQMVRSFSGHTGQVTAVAISADGKFIATASADKTARVWDAQSGDQLLELDGHKAALSSVAFSPDGKLILTGSSDKTAQLWDAKTGQSVRVFTANDAVTSVAFSADGALILTGSADKTAQLWDALTGRLVRQLTGHTDKVTDVAFSADNKNVITSSYDGTARLWDVGVADWLTLVCGHVFRDLTDLERSQFTVVNPAPTCSR